MKKLLTLLFITIFFISGCSTAEPPSPTEQPPTLQPTEAIVATPAPTEIPLSEGSTLAVHFIDVGQADAALVRCDGQTMLIDGGNVADSSLIAAYLKKLNIDYLDYIVCTHAHEDHVGGLSGALSVAGAGTVYAPETAVESDAYDNFVRKVTEQNLQITHPEHGRVINLGSSSVQFMGPVTEATDDVNNTSIVLKVRYGQTSFLFTGDAEYDEELNIVDAGYDLSADVLKVGHHGSDSSTSYIFLRHVMPKYAVISVGKDNNYDHPSAKTLSRLRDEGAEVFRTDLQGDVIATSDGENISFVTERNETAQTNPTEIEATEGAYIGNINSKKFHKPDCNSLPAEKNRVYFSSREEAVNSQYEPCGNCRP